MIISRLSKRRERYSPGSACNSSIGAFCILRQAALAAVSELAFLSAFLDFDRERLR
jgi:hypothetical protein